MKTNYILFISIFSLVQIALFGQTKQVTPQNLYWLRYTNQIALGSKFVLQNEFEERRFFAHNRHHHFIIHSRLHYKFSKFEAAAGLTYSRQSPQNPEPISRLVIPEIRPVQEMSFQTNFSKILSLQNRWRIEERFIHRNDGIQLKDGYDFNMRIRYRIQAAIKVVIFSKNAPSQIKITNEIMLNAGKRILYNQFDQNRFSIAFDQTINPHLSMELGYIHWYQQRQSGNQFYKREIGRFTISQKF